MLSAHGLMNHAIKLKTDEVFKLERHQIPLKNKPLKIKIVSLKGESKNASNH